MKAARSDPKTSITRSDIWYEDGSVVLQAQHTQFRVHWGVLARQSSFFHDMQGLPQPPDQPSVDGCPVVKLPDDIADVECLLKALYSPTFLAQAALPLPAIGALIRLGRKYDFRDLLDSAVRRLEFENPKTLEEYEALKAPATNGKTYNPTRIVGYPGIMIDFFTLARENDIVSVLPCAYYRAVAHYIPLFDGVPRGDGTTASLPPKHLRRCILARDKFISARFQEGYPLGWLKKWDHDSDCANPAKCAQARSARVYSCLDLDPLLNLYRSDEDQKVLCSACYRHATESIRAGRKKLWEDLPKFFDLLPWSELKNDL
ncbi:hypothetical protein DFH08DRAFT_695355 [Mycena albidolilacea]|uniref:BTB domain-containing protein n=1 Tax=Mycena albidolilacea TaxID=1033008 RepID=A0AAD7EVM8_9AGAR|nr:hypothetical protein DFH08DRAFT_695355 [Mycena albidolilacea]